MSSNFYPWDSFKGWFKVCSSRKELYFLVLRNTSKLKPLKIWGFGLLPQILRVWKSVGDSLPHLHPKPRPIWASILISVLLMKDVGIWGIPGWSQSPWSNSTFCMDPGLLSLVPRFGFLKPGTCIYHQGYTGFSAGLPILVLYYLIPFLYFSASPAMHFWTFKKILSIILSVLYQKGFLAH